MTPSGQRGRRTRPRTAAAPARSPPRHGPQLRRAVRGDVRDCQQRGQGFEDRQHAVGASEILDGSVGLVDVNAAEIQSRVSGTCAAGSSIRTIAQNGTVTCETDDSGGGTATGLNCAAQCVQVGEIADANVTSDKIAEQQRPDDDVLDGSLTGVDVENGTIGSLDTNATQVQLRVGSSCSAGQAIRAIAQDGTVTCEVDDTGGGGPATDLTCTGCVQTAELADLSVSAAKLAGDAVSDSSKIASATVTGQDIALQTINAQNLQLDTVGAAQINNATQCEGATTLIGELCVSNTAPASIAWADAFAHCATQGLRLPSLSEAVDLDDQLRGSERRRDPRDRTEDDRRFRLRRVRRARRTAATCFRSRTLSQQYQIHTSCVETPNGIEQADGRGRAGADAAPAERSWSTGPFPCRPCRCERRSADHRPKRRRAARRSRSPDVSFRTILPVTRRPRKLHSTRWPRSEVLWQSRTPSSGSPSSSPRSGHVPPCAAPTIGRPWVVRVSARLRGARGRRDRGSMSS